MHQRAPRRCAGVTRTRRPLNTHLLLGRAEPSRGARRRRRGARGRSRASTKKERTNERTNELTNERTNEQTNERDLRERARAAVPGLHEERRGRLLDAEAAADAARLLDEGEVGAREVHWVAVRVDLVCVWVGRRAAALSQPCGSSVSGRRGSNARTPPPFKECADLRRARSTGSPSRENKPRPSTHPPTRRSSSSRVYSTVPTILEDHPPLENNQMAHTTTTSSHSSSSSSSTPRRAPATTVTLVGTSGTLSPKEPFLLDASRSSSLAAP